MNKSRKALEREADKLLGRGRWRKKKRKSIAPPVNAQVAARAKMLTAKFTSDRGPSSHTTTCTALSCSFQKCMCV